MTLRIEDVARKDIFWVMKQKGYNVSKLAVVTGITSVTIRRFLHGARPDADTARRLAEILGISVHSIYHEGR